ncbi:MAG: LD-carboxypeptidase [Bacillus sp. (in: Bacteria)]|nr:LD-carboxypeptidase [Bacillus sp. (in: firmicutes)]
MRYPEIIQQGEVIGVTAVSSGVTGVFEKKLDNAIKQVKSLGYAVTETRSVRNDKKLVSASSEQRSKEFIELWYRRDVKTIIPPWGGALLMEILPYLEKKLEKDTILKWVIGFSDTSTLLFYLTISQDIATVHGPNFLDFGNDPLDTSVNNLLKTLQMKKGDTFTQQSYDYYQKEWLEVTNTSFPGFNKTEKVKWKSLDGVESIRFSGRMIGGCLDTIAHLIGTPYAPVSSFLEKYKNDGFIWYFESCNMDASVIYRTLWQMKTCGWFTNCNGFLFGRPDGYKDVEDFNYIDALRKVFSPVNIPVIYDVDIGHLPPQLTIINGSFGMISYKKGKGTLTQKLV